MSVYLSVRDAWHVLQGFHEKYCLHRTPAQQFKSSPLKGREIRRGRLHKTANQASFDVESIFH